MQTPSSLHLLAAFLLLSGVTHAEMPTKWKASASGITDPNVADTANWWGLFNDKTLIQVIGGLDLTTPQLAAAVQRVEQARAGVTQARSELFPTISASFGGGRSQLSQSTVTALPIRTANQWDAGVTASYEVDLWGRIRHNVRSARAAVLANEKAVEALRLSLRAEVADAYITLRGVEAELGIVEQALVTRKKNLELTQQRKTAGAGSDLEVEQARTDLLAAGVEVSALKQGRMELENIIALITGQNASSYRLPVTGELPRVPTLPRVVPSELLRRRPDIAEASHRIESALGQVKAARTAWLPSLHLQAGAGGSAERFSGLDDEAARAGTIGFSFSLPLFDGGRRRAALDAAKASHQEGVEQQRQIILAAVADAESALGKVYWGREQHAQAAASAEAAARSASLISSKFAAGGVDTFQQLLAERLRLDAARLKVRTQTAELRSVVALIRALGGGWNH